MSKLKSPEEHYLTHLQLYIPWRKKDKLKQGKKSFEDRYKEVGGEILCNVRKYEPYLDIDYEELQSLTFFNLMR